MPPKKELAKVMAKAIKPKSLKERVEARMMIGGAPYELSLDRQQWRIDAKRDPTLLRRLIRENADHMDTCSGCRHPAP